MKTIIAGILFLALNNTVFAKTGSKNTSPSNYRSCYCKVSFGEAQSAKSSNTQGYQNMYYTLRGHRYEKGFGNYDILDEFLFIAPLENSIIKYNAYIEKLTKLCKIEKRKLEARNICP